MTPCNVDHFLCILGIAILPLYVYLCGSIAKYMLCVYSICMYMYVCICMCGVLWRLRACCYGYTVNNQGPSISMYVPVGIHVCV